MTEAVLRRLVREELELGGLRRWQEETVRPATLGHATTEEAAREIVEEGMTSRVNYFSVTGRGWVDKRDAPVNVQVDGSEVYRSAYPDPEDFWNRVFPDADTPVSLRSLRDQYGWDAFRRRVSGFAEDGGLERWSGGNVAVTRPVEPHEIVSVEDYWGNEYK